MRFYAIFLVFWLLVEPTRNGLAKLHGPATFFGIPHIHTCGGKNANCCDFILSCNTKLFFRNYETRTYINMESVYSSNLNFLAFAQN